jgi:hypothetical protein
MNEFTNAYFRLCLEHGVEWQATDQRVQMDDLMIIRNPRMDMIPLSDNRRAFMVRALSQQAEILKQELATMRQPKEEQSDD